MPRFAGLLPCAALACVAAISAAPVPAARPDRMFPDGTTRDFGKVPRGTQLSCTFRVVNSGREPLTQVSIRTN